MVVANKASKFVWAYQAVAGTSIIIATTSVTYEFGEYNDESGKWNTPFVENKSLPYWVYNSNTPTLTDLSSEYPTFSHVFNPVTAQFLAWILGLPTNTTPTVTIVALASGMTYPLTIRCEETGGNNPQNAQAVDCYCIGLTAKAERGKSFLVEPEFAWGALEDINDNPNLSPTMGIPLAAGLMTKPYGGNPTVVWDSDGDAHTIAGIWRVDFMCKKEWEKVSSNVGTIQSIYTYKMQPIDIVLSAVFKVNEVWDDYVNRKVDTNMTLTIKKHDGTSNIVFTFTNCRIQTIKKTGAQNEGHYGSVCVLRAEKVEAVSDWFTEGGVTFASHWKAALA